MDQQRFLSVKDKRIPYIIRKSKRAKRIKVAVYNTGEVVLTVPFFAGIKQGERFLESKRDWLYHRVPDRIVSSEQIYKEYRARKEEARKLAWEKVGHFNRFYGLSVSRISIRNQKTRWGSCSRKGNLNFNYKIVKLPEHLSDYIIVHELCHLKELNHSKKFWDLVSQTIPDYRERRRELKQIQNSKFKDQNV